MACRKQLYSSEVATVYGEEATQHIVQSHERRLDPGRMQPYQHAEPSAPPALASPAFHDGQAVQLQAMQAATADAISRSGIALHAYEGANIYVHIYNIVHNNINEQHLVQQQHINNALPSSAAGAGGDDEQEEEREQSFQANDPPFRPAHDTKGVDIGKKLVKLWYKMKRTVVEKQRRITYTQCPSTAQTLSHAVTAHLSHHRTKHVSFLFDLDLNQELQDKFPPTVHFHEIKSLIHELAGDSYECSRKKYVTKNFSVYLYVVKRVGVRFSERGRRDWSNLRTWADSLRDTTTDNDVTSILSSAEDIGVRVLAGVVAHVATAAML